MGEEGGGEGWERGGVGGKCTVFLRMRRGEGRRAAVLVGEGWGDGDAGQPGGGGRVVEWRGVGRSFSSSSSSSLLSLGVCELVTEYKDAVSEKERVLEASPSS